MKIGEIRPAKGATRDRKRRGLGPASGLGGTAGRGHKGQRARSGGKVARWFEGGQMPIQRRLPKVGFRNPSRVDFQVVNVAALARFAKGETVTRESLDALDQMVDVAGELGVDAIGLNHLMYSTPEEVAETVRMIGAPDASVIATFVTPDPGLDVRVVREKVAALQRKCRERNILFDFRPKVVPELMDRYYTPGAPLQGRCLYPFLHARVSFSGKVYFCPFIRVEVGDLTTSSLEEIWNGEKYVDMRRRLLDNGLFPVCRRCCKVELSNGPVPEAVRVEALPRRRAIPVTVVR